MIQAVAYTSLLGKGITITMADGAIWQDDASLPADTEIRRQLADWIAAGNTITPYKPPAIAIVELKAAAKVTVDADAEAYRLTYITGGSGQAMAYTQKLDEARAYLANASLTATECSHIYAEVGITGETAEAVAQVVVGMHAAWQVKSAAIEHKRLTAKAAIDAAETAEAINSATIVAWEA